MRKKALALLVAMALAATAVTGCSTGGTSDTKTTSNKTTTLTGTVTKVGDSSITISTDDKETKEIKITDDTVITKSGMGGPGNMQAPPDGEAPSMKEGETSPDNNQNSNSQDNKQNMQAPPDGEAPSMKEGETPPEKKDDNSSGESETIKISDISQGDTVEITLDENENATEIKVTSAQNGGPQGQPGGQSSGVDSYTAVKEYSSDTTVSNEKISSTGTDENAIHVTDGANVTIDNANISRTSSDSTGGDNSSFYGVGAAVLNTKGNAYVNKSTITTDAKGGAGIFSYGDGVVYAADTTISTKQDTSGGIHVAGGGKLYAWDMNVETNGESSAAIRSDRGGGTLVANGGSYTSNGTGSPAVYSTADIAVNKATLTATNSEAVCIEGLNSLRLFNTNLTGAMKDDSQNDCTWNVILYQSMSGDSQEGNSTFEMNGGTLTAKNGGMFYTTNTESTFILNNVDITYAKDNDFFLRCTGNNNKRGWGQSGSNGADCNFTAIKQKMEGDIIWDKISKLDFYMKDGSTLTGAVTVDNTYATSGDGYCNLYISKDSKWIVTGDCTLSNLYCAGTITDNQGKTVTIKDSDGKTLVKGTGSYTITVDSYSNSVDMSGASKTTSWTDYKVEKPSQLK